MLRAESLYSLGMRPCVRKDQGDWGYGEEVQYGPGEEGNYYVLEFVVDVEGCTEVMVSHERAYGYTDMVDSLVDLTVGKT